MTANQWTLWEAFERIPDRRGRKARQFSLASLLALTLSAMIAGADNLKAVSQWGDRLPKEALHLLGLKRPPCYATYRDIFENIDFHSMESIISQWVGVDDFRKSVLRDNNAFGNAIEPERDKRPSVHFLLIIANELRAIIDPMEMQANSGVVSISLSYLKNLSSSIFSIRKNDYTNKYRNSSNVVVEI